MENIKVFKDLSLVLLKDFDTIYLLKGTLKEKQIIKMNYYKSFSYLKFDVFRKCINL